MITLSTVLTVLFFLFCFLGLFSIFTPIISIINTACVVIGVMRAKTMETEFNGNAMQLRMQNNNIVRKYNSCIYSSTIIFIVIIISMFLFNGKLIYCLWAVPPCAACIFALISLRKYNERASIKLAQAKEEDVIKASRKKARKDEEKALKEINKETKRKEATEAKDRERRDLIEAKETKRKEAAEAKEVKAEKRRETMTAVGNTVSKTACAVGTAASTAVGAVGTAASKAANSRIGLAVQNGIAEDIDAHFEDKRDEKQFKRKLKQADTLMEHQLKQGMMAIESKEQQLALEDASLKVEETASDIDFKKKAANLGVKVADRSLEDIARNVLALSSQAAIDALPDGLDDVTKAKYILDGRV